jgi:hypothetical protein
LTLLQKDEEKGFYKGTLSLFDSLSLRGQVPISNTPSKGKFEGASPLQNPYFPLSFEGEGDKGGEVDK